jgi:orotate phosphoribosyltransferase
MTVQALAAREGHFLLESGMHAGQWLDLDAVFVEPAAIAPAVDALATLLAPSSPSAICGPLLGGAFLAQALATRMRVRFYCAERVADAGGGGLFKAAYRIPAGQRGRLSGERLAVVDDVISAGSSVRATISDVLSAGAQVVAVGALMTLGDVGRAHISSLGLPLLAPAHREFAVWAPDACPLCAQGLALERPA